MTTATQLNDLTKLELLAAAEQFGVDAKSSMSKGDLVAALDLDGVTIELIRGFAPVEDDESAEAPVEIEEAPAEEADDEEEDVHLLRMTRTNGTYEIRGYVFKRDHPFALVKESDADYLIEVDGGFRVASPKEAREYYS